MNEQRRNDELTGRTAFVAGGTSGINLAIAQRLAQAGARVFVISRDPAKVAAAVATLSAVGEAQGTAADVRQFEAVAAAVARASNAFGVIDIVVSGAAGNFLADARTLSANGFRTVMDIDVNGTFNVLRASYDHLRRPGASLINISAPQAVLAIQGQVHACAAKAAINMMTRCLALEWGPDGVRVNAISPGWIADTEGFERLMGDGDSREALTGQLPLRRFGRVEDVAETALFLASDRSAYITGAIIDCDGGLVTAGATGR